MSLVSNLFLLFVAAGVIVYYLVPAKWQWLVLLAFSYIYYIAGGIRYVGFLLFSTFVTWLTALAIEKMETASTGHFLLYLSVFGIYSGCILETMQSRTSSLEICAVCILLPADPSGTDRKIQQTGTSAL